jgi:hypothetical protein
VKAKLVVFSLMVLSNPAFAQYGISNQRDMYGNLLRNGGTTSAGINQSTPNNGAIRNTPIPPPTNPVSPPKAQSINRLGGSVN